jgi:hypothetical protein
VRFVTLQAQPDKRLDQLVDAEQKWQRSEGDGTMALSRASDSMDADRANDDTPDEIRLRRKTHLRLGYRELTPPMRGSAGQVVNRVFCEVKVGSLPPG